MPARVEILYDHILGHGEFKEPVSNGMTIKAVRLDGTICFIDPETARGFLYECDIYHKTIYAKLYYSIRESYRIFQHFFTVDENKDGTLSHRVDEWREAYAPAILHLIGRDLLESDDICVRAEAGMALDHINNALKMREIDLLYDGRECSDDYVLMEIRRAEALTRLNQNVMTVTNITESPSSEIRRIGTTADATSAPADPASPTLSRDDPPSIELSFSERLERFVSDYVAENRNCKSTFISKAWNKANPTEPISDSKVRASESWIRSRKQKKTDDLSVKTIPLSAESHDLFLANTPDTRHDPNEELADLIDEQADDSRDDPYPIDPPPARIRNGIRLRGSD